VPKDGKGGKGAVLKVKTEVELDRGGIPRWGGLRPLFGMSIEPSP